MGLSGKEIFLGLAMLGIAAIFAPRLLNNSIDSWKKIFNKFRNIKEDE